MSAEPTKTCRDHDAPPAAADRILALHRACARGQLQRVQVLCGLPAASGVDLAAKSNFALRCAAENGHVAVVRYLCGLPLERGVDPGASDNNPVLAAATCVLRATWKHFLMHDVIRTGASSLLPPRVRCRLRARRNTRHLHRPLLPA